jgi:hypothetical protein
VKRNNGGKIKYNKCKECGKERKGRGKCKVKESKYHKSSSSITS